MAVQLPPDLISDRQAPDGSLSSGTVPPFLREVYCVQYSPFAWAVCLPISAAARRSRFQSSSNRIVIRAPCWTPTTPPFAGATVEAREMQHRRHRSYGFLRCRPVCVPQPPHRHLERSAPRKPGFKKLVRTGIEIFIAQRQALDLKLEVGDVKQSVEVTANQTLLETETSERGQALTPKMYQTLPMWAGGSRIPRRFSATWRA